MEEVEKGYLSEEEIEDLSKPPISYQDENTIEMNITINNCIDTAYLILIPEEGKEAYVQFKSTSNGYSNLL